MGITTGTAVATPDGRGYVVGRHKRRGTLYLLVRLANLCTYEYRADAVKRA